MANVMRYIPIIDLMEDLGEYRTYPFVKREDIHGPYCVLQQNNDVDNDRFGKMGGVITCMYHGEIIYERRLDEEIEGDDGYTLPTFICAEDYKRIKRKLEKFWIKKK